MGRWRYRFGVRQPGKARNGQGKPMGKGRSSSNSFKATQQRIDAGYNIVTSGPVVNQPSKAALRAQIPAYDESMVRRIEAKPKGKKSPK